MELSAPFKGLRVGEAFGVLLPGALAVLLVIPLLPRNVLSDFSEMSVPIWVSIPAGFSIMLIFGSLAGLMGAVIGRALGFVLDVFHQKMSRFDHYSLFLGKLFPNRLSPVRQEDYADLREYWDAKYLRTLFLPASVAWMHDQIVRRLIDLYFPNSRPSWPEAQAIIWNQISQLCPVSLRRPPVSVNFCDGSSGVLWVFSVLYFVVPVSIDSFTPELSTVLVVALFIAGFASVISALLHIRVWVVQRTTFAFLEMMKSDEVFHDHVSNRNLREDLVQAPALETGIHRGVSRLTGRPTE